ncbi:hypothetical protein L7F22_063959 [Adiantum nelumboides]|nr:hypothetical protein [Adiantum nelumboides]
MAGTIGRNFVDKLLPELIENSDETLPYLPSKDCVYRIYRDVRFSNDKTPYKTRMSATFSKEVGKVKIMEKIFIDNDDDGKRLKEIVSEESFVEMFGEPRDSGKNKGKGKSERSKMEGVDKTHPEIEWLKLKSYWVQKKFTDEEVLSENFIQLVCEAAKAMSPLVEHLNDFIHPPPPAPEMQVGIDVVFVFDGTTEPTKLRKALLRRDAHCFKSNETMSTFSALSRSEKTTGMIPPLAYIAAITNLRELGVEMIFAEGEADGLVVEVAGERNGYAVSEDSDFFIFCSKVKGCKGYVPLGKMNFVWKLSEDQTQRMRESRQPDLDLNSETDADENDGLFISFNPPPLSSSIPSSSSDQHPSLHSVRFSQRMPLVSNVLKIEWENYLRSEESSSNLDKDGEDLPQVGLQALIVASVEHLLQINDAAIDEAFARSEHLNYSEEVQKVIRGIWKGIESYSLVHSTKSFDSNPNFNFFNYPETDIDQRGWEILKVYNENYSKGKINSILIEAMTSRQWISKQYLEDREEESTQAGACRRLRRWIYAIVFDVIGMGSDDSDHAGTQAEAEGESRFSISIDEYFRVGSNLNLSSVPVQSLIELMETEIMEAASFDSLDGEIFKQNFLSLLGSIKKMLAHSMAKTLQLNNCLLRFHLNLF